MATESGASSAGWARVAAVAGAVVVVVVGFRWALPADLAVNDSTDFTTFYEPVADRLLDGDGLTVADDRPALRYPPGYPAILAGAFALADLVGVGRDAASSAVGVVSAATAAVFLHLIARRLFGDPVALLATALWTLYPLILWLTKQPNSELPFMAVLYAAVWVSVPLLEGRAAGAGRLAAVGALLAAGALIRPAGIVLVVPYLALVWWRGRRTPAAEIARSLGAMAGAFVLVLLPWSIHATGKAGHTVLIADAVGVNALEGVSLGINSEDEVDDGLVPASAQDVALDAYRLEREEPTDEQVRSFLVDQAQERPGAFAQLLAYKAVASWYTNESNRWEGLVAVMQAGLVGTAVAGGIAAWRRTGPGRAFVALVALMTLVTWMATIAVYSLARYLVPVLGLAVPLVALAIVSWWPGRAAAPEGRRVPSEP